MNGVIDTEEREIVGQSGERQRNGYMTKASLSL